MPGHVEGAMRRPAWAYSRDGEPETDGETHKERIDRELMELLNELRVALPGVQFLFAFLLIVPFQQTVDTITDFQRDVYFVALASAAVATALLIAPAAQHRILFRQQDKDGLLQAQQPVGDRRARRARAGHLRVPAARHRRAVLPDPGVADRGRAGRAPAVWWWVAVPFWQRAHDGQGDDRGEPA